MQPGGTESSEHVLHEAGRSLDVDRLPEREREIVRLRCYERMSQSEIGEAVGISQMHVSRLLRRSFDQMREWLDEPTVHDDASAAAALE